MSIARLRARVPSATRIESCTLPGHDLRFHKIGMDGSGKCDALATGSDDHIIHGAVFDIRPDEKHALDKAEGLGAGYEQKSVQVIDGSGRASEAFAYYATHTDPGLLPYDWYLQHVLVGARESQLPDWYITRIGAENRQSDPDKKRDALERALYPGDATASAAQ